MPFAQADALDREADAESIRRAQVILAEPVGLLDYRIPPKLWGLATPGVGVSVPLGSRRTTGYVVRCESGPHPEGIALRDVLSVSEDAPTVPPDVLELCLFAADYYGILPGDLLIAAFPRLPRRTGAKYRVTTAAQEAAARDAAGEETPDPRLLALGTQFPRGFGVAAVEAHLGLGRSAAGARVKAWLGQGWLQPARASKGPRKVAAYRPVAGADISSVPPRGRTMRALAQAVFERPGITASELSGLGSVHQALKRLVELGVVERFEVALRMRPEDEPVENAPRFDLTSDQQQVVAALVEGLESRTFAPFLLHGVTGSGKTEVYLRLIEQALAMGRSALVLVPEIALTPQLGARFRSRFGDRVATFHSGLTVAERRDEWERVVRGEAQIGLGARSAIFLPLPNLGVIVVDEEHEASFKQDETPRYQARDLAVWRGRQRGAVVVLGSATPSLESHANAQRGRYGALSLPQRVQARPLPPVEVLSLAQEARVGEGFLTVALAQRLEQTLASGDQAILFLNRRGFAPYVYCRDCGYAFRCSDCDVSLTLHQRRGVLACHYCGFEMNVPERCPDCDSLRLDAQGVGTEKLQNELQHLYGDVGLVRLDRDVVRTRRELHQALERFRTGQARILLGTQMVTKGHDFPGVTLVGVIAADASLNFPDFRAAERTFQVLTQVAGRAGRGKLPGVVMVQSYHTEHYAVQAAAQHDYRRFADHELAQRRELRYPPFAHLALLRCEGEDEEDTWAYAQRLATVLRASSPADVEVLGPAPAPLARLRGQWRVQVLVKAQDRGALRRGLAQLPRPHAQVKRILDVDPYSML